MEAIRASSHAADPRLTLPPWWARTSTWLLAMLLSVVPLVFTDLPPLIDFLGHMGRYRVQLDLAESPLLQQNWDFRWALIGNLGVDLLIIPLAKMFGLENAAWLVAAMLPPLMIWGMLRAARALHGTLPAAALAALPFALAYPYQYGFANYWLSIALALHAFAWWIQLEGRTGFRAAVFVPAGVIVWICHVYGWGVLGVLVGGYELSRIIISPGWMRRPGSWLAAASRCWPLLAPFALMAAWRENGDGAVTLGWFAWRWKLESLAFTLRDQSRPFDLACLGAAICLIYFGLRDKRFAVDPRLGLAALFFTALLLIIPYQLFGSAFADSRLYPVIFICAILAIRSKNNEGGRIESWIAASAALLFVARVAVNTAGFIEYDRAYDRHLQALQHIERGSRVAVFVRRPCNLSWRRPRLEHLGSIALLRREAFINTQWDVPGAQLLIAKGAPGTRFNADPSQFVGDVRTCADDLRPRLRERIDALPRDRFHYVWVFDFDTTRLPDYPGLSRLYADDRTALYRIEGSER